MTQIGFQPSHHDRIEIAWLRRHASGCTAAGLAATLCNGRLTHQLTDYGINVSERSIAVAETLAQFAIGHCPARTLEPDHRGAASAATTVAGRRRGRTPQMRTTARMSGRAIGSRSMR
jgi:hypothetical protein